MMVFALILNWVCFLEEATFSSLSMRRDHQQKSSANYGATVPATMVIDKISNFWSAQQ